MSEMKPKAHLFVVNQDTMPIHIQKGFCGIVNIQKINKSNKRNISFYQQLADLMNVRKGDLVYFYLTTTEKKKRFFEFDQSNSDDLKQGYYGIFKVTGKPFISERNVKGNFPFENYFIFGKEDEKFNELQKEMNEKVRGNPPKLKILPIRIPIEPVNNYEDFKYKFVDDNVAYIDKTDEGNLATLLFKKIKRIGEERSVTPILPEEASKIARLLFKQDKNNFPFEFGGVSFEKNQEENYVELEITKCEKNNEELALEAMLEAYIINSLNIGSNLDGLEDVVGDLKEIEFCGNQIQYGISGNKIDILLLHRKEIAGNTNYRYKATVIELKKSAVKKEDIFQINDYQKWIAQLTTFNNLKSIQPVLIGKKPSARMKDQSKKEIKNNLEKIKKLGISKPKFFEYNLIEDRGQIKIKFTEYDINKHLDI